MAFRLLPLALAFLALPVARAQAIPDTTAPARYYPLGVGDTWQYSVEETIYQYCTPCGYREVRDVTGTTVIDGQTYAVVRSRTFNVPFMPDPPPASAERYVRYDAAAARVVVRQSGADGPVDRIGCRLDEAFPARPDTTRAVVCLHEPMGELPAMTGGYGLPLDVGGVANQKAFAAINFLQGAYFVNVRYAAGLGLIHEYVEFEVDDSIERTLRYARVGGVVYGSPIVVLTEGEAGPPPVLGVRVAPNPVIEGAHLTLSVPAQGAMTVEVVDALGRVVERTTTMLETGTTTLALDTAGWAPGAYVVRVTDSTGAVATRVVVRAR